MAKRKDGRETRQKLLDVACDVFAEKGFHSAKITDICRRAGANVAAVNYYFGDKESLYVAAWRQTMERFLTSDTMPPADLPPEERIRLVIHRIIRKILVGKNDRGYFRRLELMELANPTGLIDETWKELVAPRHKELMGMIRDLMGPTASEDAVNLSGMSLLNQCRGYILMQKSGLDALVDHPITPERAEQIAAHITRFSIAGIKAIRNQGGAPPSDPADG